MSESLLLIKLLANDGDFYEITLLFKIQSKSAIRDDWMCLNVSHVTLWLETIEKVLHIWNPYTWYWQNCFWYYNHGQSQGNTYHFSNFPPNQCWNIIGNYKWRRGDSELILPISSDIGRAWWVNNLLLTVFFSATLQFVHNCSCYLWTNG